MFKDLYYLILQILTFQLLNTTYSMYIKLSKSFTYAENYGLIVKSIKRLTQNKTKFGNCLTQNNEKWSKYFFLYHILIHNNAKRGPPSEPPAKFRVPRSIISTAKAETRGKHSGKREKYS